MPTINQLVFNIRKKKKRKKKNFFLNKCPQKKGICTKILIMNPRKPNSASRKVAKIRLKTGRQIYCYIPGERHNCEQHSIVLFRGGNIKDLPGVKYKLIRGVYDIASVNRGSKRSKYGCSKNKISKFKF